MQVPGDAPELAWADLSGFPDPRAEAVRRAELVRPDVILVDLQLPDGTGIDVMKVARELDPEQRMLVLTSFDDDAALREHALFPADAVEMLSEQGLTAAQQYFHPRNPA